MIFYYKIKNEKYMLTKKFFKLYIDLFNLVVSKKEVN